MESVLFPKWAKGPIRVTLTSRDDGHQHIIDGNHDRVYSDVRFDPDTCNIILSILPRNRVPPGHRAEPNRLEFVMGPDWLAGFFRALGPAIEDYHNFTPSHVQEEFRRSIFRFLAAISHPGGRGEGIHTDHIKDTIRSYLAAVRDEDGTASRLIDIIHALAELQAEIGQQVVETIAQCAPHALGGPSEEYMRDMGIEVISTKHAG